MENIDILKSLLFYSFGGVILLFSAVSIFANRILYSLLSAVVVFFAAAGIFFILGADYNAVIQIAVYGVAIPILFILAIMFTSDDEDKKIYLAFSPRFYLAFVSIGVLLISVFYLFATVFSLNQNQSWIIHNQFCLANKYQMFKAISDGFFSNYVCAFELFSLLLLVIVVGLSTLNLTKENDNE